MTNRTRRRLIWCALLALLTIPPELAALSAVRNASQPLPERWVKGLSPAQLASAAQRIEEYPSEYRRALLSAASLDLRSSIWHRVAVKYLASHPQLNQAQHDAVMHVAELATPATFARRDEGIGIELHKAAVTVHQLLGDDAERQLFYTAGPKTRSDKDLSALPLRVRFEAFLRSHFVASARRTDCNCRTGSDDCTGYLNFCSENQGCDFQYFGCGIWYLEYCNGYCIHQQIG